MPETDYSEQTDMNDNRPDGNFLNKIKEIFEKVVSFYKEHTVKILLAALALLLVLLIIAIICNAGRSSGTEETKTTAAAAEEEYSGDRDTDLTETAISDVPDEYSIESSASDTEAAETVQAEQVLMAALSDDAGIKEVFEERYEDMKTQLYSVVDDIDLVEVYIAEEDEDGLIPAFSKYNVKFSGFDTVVPAIESCYLRVTDTGYEIYADALNDADKVQWLNTISENEPVRTWMFNAQSQLSQILSQNQDLAQMYESLSSDQNTEENED